MMSCMHSTKLVLRSSSGVPIPWVPDGSFFVVVFSSRTTIYSKVTALSADIAGMEALSLNYWLSEFLM